jgi:hypothetical protein
MSENNTDGLAERHRTMLEVESAISPEVITARGYQTVTAAGARQYGFTGQQARDGLLLPVHTTDGQVAGYVLRPDIPRVVENKNAKKDPQTGLRPQRAVKYEWPRGTPPRIDCPPLCYEHLKDASVALWITEGQKKGDALASWGLCAIDFPGGVWGWKSKSEGVLADLDYIAWDGRVVYVVFDSDVITKESVARALARLTKILSRRGAKVIPVPLPQSGGEKLGVDDFKAGGGTLEQLKAYAELGKLLPLKTDGRLPGEAESAEYIKVLTEDLGYRFRMRAIDDLIEVNDLPISDAVRAEIRMKMRDLGYRKVSEVEDTYTVWAYYNQYHPVKDYLSGLCWDGADHLAVLSTYFRDDHEAVFNQVYAGEQAHTGSAVFYLWLRRWMIGAVAKVMDARQNVMLVLDGPQNCGKSYFVRWLGSVLPDYFIETPINPEDKDTWLRLIAKFVWEVGELGAIIRRADREAMKNFITTQVVTVRRSYGKFDTIKPALASLIGTINNEAGFLTDPTGNRRFLICRLTGIDWRYKELEPDQLWAQAVALYQEERSAALTAREAELQYQINLEYLVESPFELMLDQYFGVNPEVDTWMPAMKIVTDLEGLGLRGNQNIHLKELSLLMKKRNVSKGRPSTIPGRPVSYRGVFRLLREKDSH